MRHGKDHKKLGRTKSHRRAMLSNMVASLLKSDKKQIVTTLAKAKEARRWVDKMVTFGKKDTVAARREAFKFIRDRDVISALFSEIAPKYEDRNGGYTRVVKLGERKGDGAEMAVLELVGFEEVQLELQQEAQERRLERKRRQREREQGEKQEAAEKAPQEEAQA